MTQKVRLTPDEHARSVDQFCGSVFQIRQHNWLIDRISELQLKLESATKETFAEIQAQLKEAKNFFYFIHKDDSSATKSIYATQEIIVRA